MFWANISKLKSSNMCKLKSSNKVTVNLKVYSAIRIMYPSVEQDEIEDSFNLAVHFMASTAHILIHHFWSSSF